MLSHSSLNRTLNYRHDTLSWRNDLLLYTTYQSCQNHCQVWRGHGALIQENVLCSITNVYAGDAVMILILVVTVILFSHSFVTVHTLQCHTDQIALSGSSHG